MQEIYYPVVIERQQLREGSGGAGKFRGGLGIEVTVRVLCDASTNINVERQRTAPWGLFDGECGEKAKALVKQATDDPGTWLTKKPNYPLKQGGSVTFFGTQARVAFTERLSVVMSEFGYLSLSPSNPIPSQRVSSQQP